MSLSGLVLLALLAVARAQSGFNPAPLSTVKIPLSVDRNLRYTADVNMSSSPDTQRFRFALAANTGYTSVAGTSCSTCDNVPAYNRTLSASVQSFPGSKNVTLGTQSVVGNFIKENCGLREVNGTAWQYPNQTIIVANDSSLFSDLTSGIVGLGTNANGATGDFDDTIYGGWLIRNPTQNNFSFGMALSAPKFDSETSEGNGGHIDWVVPDHSAYTGTVATRNAMVSSGSSSSTDVVSNSFGLTDNDWVIEMDGWAATLGGASVSNSTSVQALLEPLFPSIYFPASQANLLYAGISGAQQLPTPQNGGQVWSIPCDTQMQVGFQFGQNFLLDQEVLVIDSGNGTCTGAIQGWPDETTDSYLLGGSFISGFYVIFIIGRPGSGVPNSVSIANRFQQSSKTNVGAIVGGVVGGVVFIAAVGLAIFYLVVRKRRIQRRAPSAIAKEEAAAAAASMGGMEKYYDEHGAAQYANPLRNSYASRSGLPTPPHSAFTTTSSHPLLPEAQSPVSPLLNVPGSPTPMAAMTYVTPMGATALSSRGNYNPSEAGSHVARSSTMYTTADGQNITIDPFMMPPSAQHSPSSAGFSQSTKGQQSPSWQGHTDASSATSHDAQLINFGPSGSSAASEQGSVRPYGAQAIPLAPPPMSRKYAEAIASGDAPRSIPRQLETPAPPYSQNSAVSESETLLD
ncbi:acid protease [Schizopora paradoxa]|uniref:Acid protease n=1 Tax=Schizopora paradoxa TaxID=27342 RepID=A0A0H2R9Z6_9AGAM|nr:acid protease [Schizopora paradoxa]